MRRPPQTFSEKESAILVAIYENPNMPYTTYSLMQQLNPTVKPGNAEAQVAFEETREAVEQLIVASLVRGKRLKNAEGVFFSELKLTTKGEQTAIQERRKMAELEKILPEIIKRSQTVLEEMDKSEEGK